MRRAQEKRGDASNKAWRVPGIVVRECKPTCAAQHAIQLDLMQHEVARAREGNTARQTQKTKVVLNPVGSERGRLRICALQQDVVNDTDTIYLHLLADAVEQAQQFIGTAALHITGCQQQGVKRWGCKGGALHLNQSRLFSRDCRVWVSSASLRRPSRPGSMPSR